MSAQQVISSAGKLLYTPVASIPNIVALSRHQFNTGMLIPVEKRKEVLRSLLKMMNEEEETFIKAIGKDLGRNAEESRMVETIIIKNEISFLLQHLSQWVKPVSHSGIHPFQNCKVWNEPKGVVLVIAPWNYPLQMLMMPLVGAIAAGNTVVLKPSELAESTAQVLTETLPRYGLSDVVSVVNGGVAEVTALLEQRFDHIFFTGAPSVGKIVMAAAAKNLTPVTLELGGKSPVVIDDSVTDIMEIVVSRIFWGKFVNCGQTCIAPDYVLIHRSVKELFVSTFKKIRQSFYGTEDLLRSPHYGCIVNSRHFDRIDALLSGGTVIVGGEKSREDLKFATTLLDDVDLSSPLMTEEIFGPLLPLVVYDRLEEAMTFVKEREKPLALYVFTQKEETKKKFETETTSGGLVFNDVLLHVGVTGLPFGGVGNSGLGQYHGKYSFDTFSHPKTVLREGTFLDCFMKIRYPPYSSEKPPGID